MRTPGKDTEAAVSHKVRKEEKGGKELTTVRVVFPQLPTVGWVVSILSAK